MKISARIYAWNQTQKAKIISAARHSSAVEEEEDEGSDVDMDNHAGESTKMKHQVITSSFRTSSRYP
jgi:hypothetical protein